MKLQSHLVQRIRSPGLATDREVYPAGERHLIVIQANRIFRHKVFCINYTSYDIRRSQDSTNPRTQADVMILALDLDPDTGESLSGHPYAYARILGVFHAEVAVKDASPRASTHTMEFLWVRWYQFNETHRGGFTARRLHRLSFIPEEDPNAYGFLDPDDVIRAIHLIPAFAHGTIDETSDYTPIVWKYYYINLYVSFLSSLYP